ncbi:MAG: DUF4397 domain-containing protein [Chloroherpetonaceae bacterium]|nr:DUF4397 domain-containing protein [Chloroherpetonaceae bacterium]MCS7211991.1 DUF4397 domain-containing protein [Chloroherpetonaceae bacterium]MDW8020313.1 DUF4397 domain-containing protein [Chloroherpetonaceae bacterium]
MHRKNIFIAFLTIASLALWSAACRIKATEYELPPLTAVRFVHAAPNAPAVNVLLNNNRFNDTTFALLGATSPTATPATISFPSASAFFPVSAGPTRIRIFPATPRATPTNNVQPVIDATDEFPRDGAKTYFVVGNAAPLSVVISDDKILTDILDTVNFANAIRAGRAGLRVAHMSLSATPVSVNVVAQRVGAAATTLFSNIAPRTVSDIAQVDAGTYNIFVLRAGAADTLGRLTNVAIGSRRVFTVMARGTVDSTRVGSPAAFGLTLLTDR